MRFPDGFLFGFSTSAYQIEGAVHEGGRGRSIWDSFCHLTGTIAGGETGDWACDHYHRFREDVALLEAAGAQVYRFSIAWPRVLPEGKGTPSTTGLDFYDRLIDELLERGIDPWPCLYHWDLPQALQDRGGWPNRDTAFRFVDYAALVLQGLGDRLGNLILLNEPSIAAVMGHLAGRHAPGIRDRARCLAAAHHLNLATGLGAKAVRELRPRLRVGTVLALNRIEPATDLGADLDAAEVMEGFMNGAYLDPLFFGCYPEPVAEHFKPWQQDGDGERIRTDLDFLGVNYYTRVLAHARKGAAVFDAAPAPPPPEAEVTDMGWEIHPEGLYQQLRILRERYGNPALYITENGAAFPDEVGMDGRVSDPRRVRYLREHLEACLRAIDDGVDLRGYFVWSLLDNFEWADGYSKRFGLVRVDFETLERTPKESFRWFARVTATRELDG